MTLIQTLTSPTALKITVAIAAYLVMAYAIYTILVRKLAFKAAMEFHTLVHSCHADVSRSAEYQLKGLDNPECKACNACKQTALAKITGSAEIAPNQDSKMFDDIVLAHALEYATAVRISSLLWWLTIGVSLYSFIKDLITGTPVDDRNL